MESQSWVGPAARSLPGNCTAGVAHETPPPPYWRYWQAVVSLAHLLELGSWLRGVYPHRAEYVPNQLIMAVRTALRRRSEADTTW